MPPKLIRVRPNVGRCPPKLARVWENTLIVWARPNHGSPQAGTVRLGLQAVGRSSAERTGSPVWSRAATRLLCRRLRRARAVSRSEFGQEDLRLADCPAAISGHKALHALRRGRRLTGHRLFVTRRQAACGGGGRAGGAGRTGGRTGGRTCGRSRGRRAAGRKRAAGSPADQ